MNIKTEKNALLILTNEDGTLHVKVDKDLFEDFMKDGSNTDEDHDGIFETHHADTAIPLFLLAYATACLLTRHAQESKNPPADGLFFHISALAAMYAEHLEESEGNDISPETIEAIKHVGMRIANEIITIYKNNEDEIAVKINNKIGNLLYSVDTTNDLAERSYFVTETLTQALALAAKDAIDHGVDKKAVIEHLANSFAEALSEAIPELEVTSGLHNGKPPASEPTPSQTKKKGRTLPS